MVFKVAILIDGGFFRARFKSQQRRHAVVGDIAPFINDVMARVQQHTPPSCHDILFRIFFYDCRPFLEKRSNPTGQLVDFAASPVAASAGQFLNDLRSYPQLALRLGDLSFDGWKQDPRNAGKWIPDFKQKSVDMKIGLDIAWMASKKVVDKLVLVTGDADFVSAMKFARKEGLLVYLEPMRQSMIKLVLKEHSDFVL